MSDKKFPDGIIFKLPRENAPDYVIGAISIKKKEALVWIKEQDGDWINLDLLVSKEGKPYCAVNEYKKPSSPKPEETDPIEEKDDRDLPF